MPFIAANGMTEEETSRTVQALGTTIHYHEMGEGYPLILMHSFGPGTTAWITWYKVIAEFAKHFRVIAMDLPNFAKTGPVVLDENTHSFQAKTALALMDALGIEKAHFAGNSQGGQSSMAFAYHNPDRINKLVWGAGHIGTNGGYRNEYLMSNYPEEGVKAAGLASRNPTRDNFKAYLELQVCDTELITDEVIDYTMGMHTGRADLVEMRGRTLGRPNPYDHSDAMINIKCPTLIIWGRQDRTCTFEIGLNSLNIISNSQLVVIREASHWVPFEKPREYAKHVLAFLKDDSDLAIADEPDHTALHERWKIQPSSHLD
jgi:2-hydroxy-6-oxonona-2,4-dienedioate hydrolase